jgi:outer membrane immunogenic protein
MRATFRAAVAACLLIFCFLAVGVALAADTGGPIPTLDDLQAPPAVHNRTAAYVGLTAGANIAQFEADGFKFADTAWMVGGFAGFNVRLPRSPFVVGLEADYIFTDVSAGQSSFVVAREHYLASARARLGVGVGPALLYVTGGPAFTESKITTAVTDKNFMIGAALGAGVEAELTKTMFLRLEAIHYIFPDQDTSCGLACTFQSKDQQSTVRMGVGFKLN